jgi:hypothetical protein
MPSPRSVSLAALNEQKWRRMMERGIRTYMRQSPESFRRRAKRGIPRAYRWQVWKACVDYEAHFRPEVFACLAAQPSRWEAAIRVDMPRTFTEGSPTLTPSRGGAEKLGSLEKILRAYANLNPEVGYCQGMNFVAAFLQVVADEASEEEVFWVFAGLMEWSKGLSGFFKEGFPRLGVFVNVFDELLDINVPDLRRHFVRTNVQPSIYIHNWFLTLFVNCLPSETVLVLWDALFSEGLEVLLVVTVALLKVLKDVLISMDFEEVIRFFKTMKTGEESSFDAALIGRLLVRHGENLELPSRLMKTLKDNDAVGDAVSLHQPHPDYTASEASRGSGRSWIDRVSDGIESLRSSINRTSSNKLV